MSPLIVKNIKIILINKDNYNLKNILIIKKLLELINGIYIILVFKLFG